MRFYRDQPVWYFDYLSVSGEGPQERVFKHYAMDRFFAKISSPYGYDVLVNARNVYESREAAIAGETVKQEADCTLEQIAAEEALLDEILDAL